jgi:16S rRNA (cytidine1402-2'-O)-methyltransferase
VSGSSFPSNADQGPGILWVVATPIGTLDDLSPRACRVLGEVDFILAEDTRRARTLLSHLGLPARGRLRSLHEHNEKRQVEPLVEALQSGRSLALISDAGMPVLSDPGYLLVREVRSAGHRVCSIPGASSFTAALAAAGQPPLPATLSGFLPARPGPRRRRIAELSACPWTLVVLLSPHRLARELADIAEIMGGEREATLLAEISKMHERAVVATLDELAAGEEAANPRGEYIIVIGPGEIEVEALEVTPEKIRSEYRKAVSDGLNRPEALRQTARRLGLRRRQVFDLLADEKSGH